MIKRIKVILILFLAIGIILSPLKKVNAHSVELDPESLISMPYMIVGGNGKVTIKSSITDYTLHFQAIQIASVASSEIEKTKREGEVELNNIKEAYTDLKIEVDNLKEIYDSASDAYTEGLENTELSEAEVEELKIAYETARTNYQNKVKEYNNKIDEYNAKTAEINSKINELTPTYVENNWVQTTDNKVSIDTTQFSGQQTYVIWVKLVTSSGTYYDEAIYTMIGTKDIDDDETPTTTGKTDKPTSTGTTTEEVPGSKPDSTTTAKGPLPNAGVSSIFIIALVGISILTIVFYKKYKYLNIK